MLLEIFPAMGVETARIIMFSSRSEQKHRLFVSVIHSGSLTVALQPMNEIIPSSMHCEELSHPNE